MITSLRLVNFKNFADETLRVGPFTVIVGANASGKSNIRDAFRFLHGIGRGYTLAEILGGKYGEGGQREWDGIRGAPNEITRLRKTGRLRMRDFSIHIELNLNGEKIDYSITIRFNPNRPDGFRVLEEEARTDSGRFYTTLTKPRNARLPVLIGDRQEQQRINLSRLQPALTQFGRLSARLLAQNDLDPETERNLKSPSPLELELESIRFLELSPERMREPTIPGTTTLGDFGQNLPSVLKEICADPERKRTLMSWLQELTPMDVKDFAFPRDPSGRVHLQIVERNGRKVSAYSASDGTLRFLAMLAALLGPNPAGVYFFEEIDNGIHPNRLWLLLDLIEKQTAKNGIQVITTAHSPALLSWIRDEAFEHTSIVYRDEYWSDSVIRPVADLYDLRELRKSRTLGELHTEGWLETAMKFKEGDADTDHLDEERGEIEEDRL